MRIELKDAHEEELGQFLQTIFAMDQNDLQRTNASQCYKMLKSRETEFIGSSLEPLYWHSLSFELFHLAQQALFQQNEDAKALLNESLSAAHQGYDKPWIAYIEGTINYLENNPEHLQQNIPLAGGNHVTLKKLLMGLEERGYPNYFVDYGKK